MYTSKKGCCYIILGGGFYMAVGSKYAPLTEMLQNCGEDIVRLTFDELNRVITIPSYAYKDRS